MDAEQLFDLIENAGYEPREYSGRGMYGRKCIGYTVERGTVIRSVANLMFAAACNGDDLEALCSEFSNAQNDEMGRNSVIVYFPAVKI